MLRRLVHVMEEREKEAQGLVERIERDWQEVGEKADRREAAFRDEIERERRAREEAEKKFDHLQTVMEKMQRGDLPLLGRSGTPIQISSSDEVVDGMMGLSPTVAMASRAQKTGKTFTEVYADYVRLQEQFAKKSAEYDHMDRTLASVLGQIEERVSSTFTIANSHTLI